jgi:cytochrome c biogenesis protein CcdA
MTGAMTFAFGAGLLATVNPCGFVMLPGLIGCSSAAATTTSSRRSSDAPTDLPSASYSARHSPACS